MQTHSSPTNYTTLTNGSSCFSSTSIPAPNTQSLFSASTNHSCPFTRTICTHTFDGTSLWILAYWTWFIGYPHGTSHPFVKFISWRSSCTSSIDESLPSHNIFRTLVIINACFDMYILVHAILGPVLGLNFGRKTSCSCSTHANCRAPIKTILHVICAWTVFVLRRPSTTGQLLLHVKLCITNIFILLVNNNAACSHGHQTLVCKHSCFHVRTYY